MCLLGCSSSLFLVGLLTAGQLMSLHRFYNWVLIPMVLPVSIYGLYKGFGLHRQLFILIFGIGAILFLLFAFLLSTQGVGHLLQRQGLEYLRYFEQDLLMAASVVLFVVHYFNFQYLKALKKTIS